MVISLVSPWCYLNPQKMHTSFIQNWGFESCCSGFRRRRTWFLRIIQWEIFSVAKRWITFRVLANWISFWYSNILLEVYKKVRNNWRSNHYTNFANSMILKMLQFSFLAGFVIPSFPFLCPQIKQLYAFMSNVSNFFLVRTLTGLEQSSLFCNFHVLR